MVRAAGPAAGMTVPQAAIVAVAAIGSEWNVRPPPGSSAGP
jgi:hypothetical protein